MCTGWLFQGRDLDGNDNGIYLNAPNRDTASGWSFQSASPRKEEGPEEEKRLDFFQSRFSAGLFSYAIMSRYDIKDEYDLEAQREVRLTSYTTSLDDPLRFVENKNCNNLPAEVEKRIPTLELPKNEEKRANGNGKFLYFLKCFHTKLHLKGIYLNPVSRG